MINKSVYQLVMRVILAFGHQEEEKTWVSHLSVATFPTSWFQMSLCMLISPLLMPSLSVAMATGVEDLVQKKKKLFKSCQHSQTSSWIPLHLTFLFFFLQSKCFFFFCFHPSSPFLQQFSGDVQITRLVCREVLKSIEVARAGPGPTIVPGNFTSLRQDAL